MKITRLDHFVLTTEHLDECLNFYSDVLGMDIDRNNNRYALRFGKQKINIHTRKAEYLPAARYPQCGSLDICLVIDEPIEAVYQELKSKGVALETGIVERNGAMGRMKSIYLRDPDGNLIELCMYEETD